MNQFFVVIYFKVPLIFTFDTPPRSSRSSRGNKRFDETLYVSIGSCTMQGSPASYVNKDSYCRPRLQHPGSSGVSQSVPVPQPVVKGNLKIPSKTAKQVYPGQLSAKIKGKDGQLCKWRYLRKWLEILNEIFPPKTGLREKQVLQDPGYVDRGRNWHAACCMVCCKVVQNTLCRRSRKK